MSSTADIPDTRGDGRHAIVVGASIAGLLAARILTDYFERVTILERDRLPESPTHRRGVPQSHHLHVLLMRGQREMDGLFPGLVEEMVEAGAPVFDWMGDFKWLNFAGWKPRFRSDLIGVGCSRELLEWTIRSRLASHPRVRVAEGCVVTGLLSVDRGRRVGGVTVRRATDRDATGDGQYELHADLVIDASGRDSRASEWLEALGYPTPQMTVINSFVGYASRCVRLSENPDRDWKGLYIQSTPPSIRRGGVIWPVEGNRWMVALVGVGRDYPPTDEAGFLEFARSLPDASIYDALCHSEPLSPIYGIRRTENRLRQYDRLPRRLEGFLVTGDAACALNPVYGQGMTAAALSARALDTSLHRQARRLQGGDLTGLARDFQRRLARAHSVAWMLSTGEDFRVREVEGGKPGPFVHLLHRYVDAVMVAGATDSGVHRTITEVLGLLKPPSALFQPRIAALVLQGAVTAQRQRIRQVIAAARTPAS